MHRRSNVNKSLAHDTSPMVSSEEAWPTHPRGVEVRSCHLSAAKGWAPDLAELLVELGDQAASRVSAHASLEQELR